MQALYCGGSVRNAVKREKQPDSPLACSYGNSISFDGVYLNTFHLMYVLFFRTSMNKVTPKESIDWIFRGSETQAIRLKTIGKPSITTWRIFLLREYPAPLPP